MCFTRFHLIDVLKRDVFGDGPASTLQLIVTSWPGYVAISDGQEIPGLLTTVAAKKYESTAFYVMNNRYC